MPLKALKVKVNTPADVVPYGRGFYQLEEESLYLPVEYPQVMARFFSYLESPAVSLSLDREGRLIFIEVNLPRRRWRIKNNLIWPETADPADIRFLDFRESFISPAVYCDRRRQNLLIIFGRNHSVSNYYLAENIITQVDSRARLMTIWISDIEDDLAGREIADWRRRIRGIYPSPPHRLLSPR
jgi:hypothetical protein